MDTNIVKKISTFADNSRLHLSSLTFQILKFCFWIVWNLVYFISIEEHTQKWLINELCVCVCDRYYYISLPTSSTKKK